MTNPVALVTGSGRKRVGFVVARALAEAGYDIGVHYHRSREDAEDSVQQLRGLGRQAVSLQADVADEQQVRRMFEQLQQQFGRLDVLVTTASIWRTIALEKVTADDVRRSFEVNTLGTFLCCQHGGLLMTTQEQGGVIVTIGDWAVARPYPDHAAYFTAKGSIATLTRTFAVELARRNPRVRVNCIDPGPVMFPPGMSSEQKESAVNATLLKQANLPESVSQSVLYLIQNPFVTGVVLPVDGGRTIYAPEEN